MLCRGIRARNDGSNLMLVAGSDQAFSRRKYSSVRKAWADAALAIGGWRVWATMAGNDIAQRYRRSVIGPFWITISTAIFVGALGWLYAGLMHQSIHDYLPFVAVGYVVWGLLSAFLLEAGQCFVAADGYLKQVNLSKIGIVLRMLLRNFIIFLHNTVVIVAVMLLFHVVPGRNAGLAALGLLLDLWFGLALALPLAMVCTRFRDLNQMIGSLVSVLFFITPVFWNPHTASKALVMVGMWNPFSALIAVVRDPLLGTPIALRDWQMAAGCDLGASLIAMLLFVRFRARIMYWL